MTGMYDRGFEMAAENLPDEPVSTEPWHRVSPKFYTTKEAYDWLEDHEYAAAPEGRIRRRA